MTDMSPVEHFERTMQLLQMHNRYVAEYGWSCQGVFGTADEPTNSFTYSIGLGLHGGYEFCAGGLNAVQGQQMLSYIYDWLTDGNRPTFGVKTDVGLLLPIQFAEMTDEHEMNITELWYDSLAENVTFTPVQVLWPDREGKCPGDEGMNPEFLNPQKIPGSPPHLFP